MAFDGSKFFLSGSETAKPRTWKLSGTDAVTVVRASGYIPNNYGVANGDRVVYHKTDDAPATSQEMIANVNSVTKVVDLSDGTAITSTNT